jgi:membrane protein
MALSSLWPLVKQTFSDWREDKAARLAAALAYYTVFSIAPLFVIAIGIAGIVFGQEAAQGRIYHQLASLLGDDASKAIQEMIANSRKQDSGILATFLGLGALLFGASGAFIELQDSMNTIWEVKPKPGTGLMGFIRDRLLSFAMVLGIGFLLLVSLILSAGIAAMGGVIEGLLPSMEVLAQAVNFALALAVMTLLFAMMFKFLPDAKIAWRDVWIGAAATALLFAVGKLLIGLYLGKSAVSSTYGAFGALVILLIWVYYSAQILFLGAEFTQVYATRFGSRIVPTENAVPEEEAEYAASRRETRRPAPAMAFQQAAPRKARANRRETQGALSRASAAVGMLLGFVFALRRVRRPQ